MDAELEIAHRQAAGIAELVALLADRVREIGKACSAHPSAMADFAAAVDALAVRARTAVSAIEDCLALGSLCSAPGSDGVMARSQFELASRLTMALEGTLDAAVAIYARMCGTLADDLSVLEEHVTMSPCASGERLTAAGLAEHARALTHSAATRHGNPPTGQQDSVLPQICASTNHTRCSSLAYLWRRVVRATA
jgi:hypothetical protein